MTDKPYEQWLAERREVSAPATLADEIMSQVANMERLSEQFPDARVLYTWNAPENRYLLKVNLQLGFATAGVTGIWQKELPNFGPSNS